MGGSGDSTNRCSITKPRQGDVVFLTNSVEAYHIIHQREELMENQASNSSNLAVGEANTQNYWTMDICEYCVGRGWLHSRVYLSCPDCDGNGEIDFDGDAVQPHTLSLGN